VTFPARAPAYVGVPPSSAIWQPVAQFVEAEIQARSGLVGKVEKLAVNAAELSGYYRLTCNDESRFFVKVVADSAVWSLREADRIAQWLNSQGILVSYLLDGFPKCFADGTCVLVYHYIDGEYVAPSERALKNLGLRLAHLHKAFRELPWEHEVRRRGLSKHRKLTELLAKVKSGSVAVPSDVAALLIEEVELDLLDVLLVDPQVIHGDLNLSNILICTSSDEIAFLDFEDTYCAWLSPKAELSFVLERFAMSPTDEISLGLARALLGGYFAEYDGQFCNAGASLTNMLRALSVRSLLTLVYVHQVGTWSVPAVEWSKFIRSYRQACSRLSLLRSIQEEFTGLN
jgi:Ser/Thr protein kinase RdoA (MazF antagonist)